MKLTANTKVIIAVALALVVGGGAGFFGGMKYQESKTVAGRVGNGNFQFQANGGTIRNGGSTGRTNGNGNGVAFRPVDGEIASVDDKSITVKMTDGTSRIILFSDSTMINKSLEASKTDLTVGQKVAVFGTQNSDGSVTAQSIELNPVMRNISASPMPQQ